jgi:hypothetical protein
VLTARAVPRYLESLFEEYGPEDEEGGPDNHDDPRKVILKRVK